MRSINNHLRANSQEIPQPSVTEISLKITNLKFRSDLPGTNGVNHVSTRGPWHDLTPCKELPMLSRARNISLPNSLGQVKMAANQVDFGKVFSKILCAFEVRQAWLGRALLGYCLAPNDKHEYTKNFILKYYLVLILRYVYSYVQNSFQPCR